MSELDDSPFWNVRYRLELLEWLGDSAEPLKQRLLANKHRLPGYERELVTRNDELLRADPDALKTNPEIGQNIVTVCFSFFTRVNAKSRGLEIEEALQSTFENYSMFTRFEKRNTVALAFCHYAGIRQAAYGHDPGPSVPAFIH